MAVQTTFERYELKYLLNPRQKARVLEAMEPHMALDNYGRTTIRNIYFDTENYRLIRRSLEKPAYKEKLRIRSYQQVGPEDSVFVELKKKYKSVVYKRRLVLSQEQTARAFSLGLPLLDHSQIGREIQYFRDYYGDLRPAVFLSYEREAYYERSGGDFRVTFDENILYRREDLSLESPAYGTSILPQGRTLMELKISGGIPLWMSHVLNRMGIYKTSFSKYGAAYQDMLAARPEGGLRYA